MDRDLLLENIVRYCKAKDEPPTKVCINAGVGKDFIGSVRSGKIPSVAKVMNLAAYFGCSTSDLVGDSGRYAVCPETVPLYEQLNEAGREMLRDYAEYLVSTGKYKNNAVSDSDTDGGAV